MGKRGRGRGRGGGGLSAGRRDDRPSKNDGEKGGYPAHKPHENENFTQYYKAQSILEPSEWEEFIKACQATLPTTFRVTASRSASKAVTENVENFFVPHLSDVVFEGVKQSPPTRLPWYPQGLAWQLDVAKQVVRKSPEFAKFQQFLVHESESGNISRQEAVSMIPPCLLDVQPHHFVLDCCAAPGSKTTQLLEALHSMAAAEGSHAASMPPGLLIANDSDAKRCHMLVHQSLNRIGSPNTMITNLDASSIPTIKRTDPETGKLRALQFDRILCDVPCSGDGTMRKNPAIWGTWRTSDALGLHSLQLRILTRGIQMLKPGGRLVYSTCSFNPIENEAVVAAALNVFPNMSLVDVSDKLPELKRRKGLTTWKVYDKTMTPLDAYEEPAEGVFKKNKGPAKTCWPHGNEEELGLERCLRLYPHIQNTGGFFVALLEKAPLPTKSSEKPTGAETSAETPADTPAETPVAVSAQESREGTAEASTADASSAQKAGPASSSLKRAASETPLGEKTDEKRTKVEDAADSPAQSSSGEVAVSKATEGGGRPFNEDPFSFLSETDEQVQICKEFFDLNDEFPQNQLLVRNANAQPLRSIYLTSSTVRDIILNNDYAKMRLVSCGVKIFARQDSGQTGVYKCKWRVLQDGLSVITPYMGPKRKVKASLTTLSELVKAHYPPLSSFSSQEFKEAAEKLDPGSCICEIQAGEEAGGKLENNMTLPLWRAPSSICLMVEKADKRALALRIFGEDLTKGSFDNSPHKKGKGPATKEGKGEKDEVVAKEERAVEEEAKEKEEMKTDGADSSEIAEIEGRA